MLFVSAVCVGAVGVPVNAGEANGASRANDVANPVMPDCGRAGMSAATRARSAAVADDDPEGFVATTKFGKPLGSEAPESAAVTKAVVATCVVLVPPVAVGAVGTPVNAGDARGATVAALAAV